MVNGDFSIVQHEARTQVAAGAHILDLNAGIPGQDEPDLLKATLQAVMEVVDVPLSIDTADPDALAASLSVYPGKALINSTTAEVETMERVFPLAREYGAAVIGVIMDKNGIPKTPEVRLDVARRLVDEATKYDIPPEDIVIDPLAMAVCTDPSAALVTLDSLQLIRKELGVNLSLGASNVSFGLPDRKTINTAYLALAISRGLTSAITDPTASDIRNMIIACDLLLGHDEYALGWIKEYRKRSKETE